MMSKRPDPDLFLCVLLVHCHICSFLYLSWIVIVCRWKSVMAKIALPTKPKNSLAFYRESLSVLGAVNFRYTIMGSGNKTADNT